MLTRHRSLARFAAAACLFVPGALTAWGLGACSADGMSGLFFAQRSSSRTGSLNRQVDVALGPPRNSFSPTNRRVHSATSLPPTSLTWLTRNPTVTSHEPIDADGSAAG